MRYRQLLLGLTLTGFGCSGVFATEASPSLPTYRMVARYPIGGTDTGYDYLHVDAPSRRVFIAHANRVEVVNADTGAKLGEITGMHGAHGIEIVDSVDKGYISDGLDRAVTVFEPKTLKVLNSIKPTGVKLNPRTQQIFTSNREGTLSVLHEISPDRYETQQTVTTEPGARTLALDEKTGRIFLPTARTGAKPAGGGAAPILPETFVLLVAGH